MLCGCCRAETQSQQRDEGNVWESSHGGAGECHSLHSHESFQLAMNEPSMNEERAAEATLLALAPYLVAAPAVALLAVVARPDAFVKSCIKPQQPPPPSLSCSLVNRASRKTPWRP